MATRPGGEEQQQQQQQQRLTQANLQQHAQSNPSVPHPTRGRQPSAAVSEADNQPEADAVPADGAGEVPAAAAEDSPGAAAPLERGHSAAVEHAAKEGASVSAGLPLNASTYSDDTLGQPPPVDAAGATLPSLPSREARGRKTAAAADAAVAAVDADCPIAETSTARADEGGLRGGSGGQSAAERAADGGVSVSTGLGDDASIGTDTTFRQGTASGRPSFESSLAAISETGPAVEAAREGVSVSTGLGQRTSIASDTTVDSRGGLRTFCLAMYMVMPALQAG